MGYPLNPQNKMVKSTFNGVVLDTDSLQTQNIEVVTHYAGCYAHRLMLIKSLKTGKITRAVMHIDNQITEFKQGLAFGSYLAFFTNNVKAYRASN
jgi:hypothetical protein